MTLSARSSGAPNEQAHLIRVLYHAPLRSVACWHHSDQSGDLLPGLIFTRPRKNWPPRVTALCYTTDRMFRAEPGFEGSVRRSDENPPGLVEGPVPLSRISTVRNDAGFLVRAKDEASGAHLQVQRLSCRRKFVPHHTDRKRLTRAAFHFYPPREFLAAPRNGTLVPSLTSRRVVWPYII